MRSPTGKPIRGSDAYGNGAFGASRKSAYRAYSHGGIDFLAAPNQTVVAPVSGFVSRAARPYGDSGPGDSGLVIDVEREALQIKMFYVRPAPGIVGRYVVEGQPVGRSLSLQARYPGISDHIHLEVWDEYRRIDPTRFFQADQPPPADMPRTV